MSSLFHSGMIYIKILHRSTGNTILQKGRRILRQPLHLVRKQTTEKEYQNLIKKIEKRMPFPKEESLDAFVLMLSL